MQSSTWGGFMYDQDDDRQPKNSNSHQIPPFEASSSRPLLSPYGTVWPASEHVMFPQPLESSQSSGLWSMDDQDSSLSKSLSNVTITGNTESPVEASDTVVPNGSVRRKSNGDQSRAVGGHLDGTVVSNGNAWERRHPASQNPMTLETNPNSWPAQQSSSWTPPGLGGYGENSQPQMFGFVSSPPRHPAPSPIHVGLRSDPNMNILFPPSPLDGQLEENASNDKIAQPSVQQNKPLTMSDIVARSISQPAPKTAPPLAPTRPVAVPSKSKQTAPVAGDATDGSVYQVKFKRSQRNFLYAGTKAHPTLKVGAFVRVEADRGEDLGVVIEKVPLSQYTEEGANTAGHKPKGFGSIFQDARRVLRVATEQEKQQLKAKYEEEEQVLKVCRSKVKQRSLPMHVIDAEYQFDRHKLTFFFEAERRIDFRELVRDLFSVYKTRIWLQQIDMNPSQRIPGCSSSSSSGGDTPPRPRRSGTPDAFICPLTRELMKDPCMCADGHTYERKAIEDWLKANDTSPKTGKVLDHKMLTANLSLQSAIEDFLGNNDDSSSGNGKRK